MALEWNKVTWYSKSAAVVVFVGVFALGFHVGTQYGPETNQPSSAATTSSNNKVPAPQSTPYTSTKTPTAGTYAAVVSLTSSGFVPKNLQIKPGQTVHFVNTTNASMRLYSDTYQKNNLSYSGFDELYSVGKNGTYDFLFNDPGVWTYYNLNGNRQVTGTVIVQ